ncbi:2-deoxy-D-gluconate 3-dehydrogenase [Halobacillus andaensis]|uniref:2-deoxy-D-gluconate 3-dehydrogenase n=1 Tax=Halobacillus andaensis TaxID=1176239 RepID=A0A917B8I1_HALAA|nr:2-dehydro-3-deoxy-D-gluconate 5-dehydrogenase KduD [Halobacillus andaensis]MBP2005236.1 2-deoxy-D-gluconate 3-dehydrogenase [Halobacillus andaensis]GGF29920.1 2-deoxy-D-gluconate 3-dehydrogenase [Halobacillus andaensis]
MEYFNLDGKVALVTGGNRGLGGAMAYGLAEAGADVAIVQRSSEETDVAANIRELGRKCEVFSFDISETNLLSELVDSVNETFGQIDILVNNAGVQHRSPAAEFKEEDWDFVIDVNQKAVFFLCQLVGRKMLKQGSGKIINLASLLSFQGGFTVPAYAAAKGGVAQFTKSLSNEWASRNVNVNAIAPGYMATDMNTALIQDDSRNRQILERIPAGRWGKPEDMVGAAIFLASRASDYINGEIITVDGGWMGR